MAACTPGPWVLEAAVPWPGARRQGSSAGEASGDPLPLQGTPSPCPSRSTLGASSGATCSLATLCASPRQAGQGGAGPSEQQPPTPHGAPPAAGCPRERSPSPPPWPSGLWLGRTAQPSPVSCCPQRAGTRCSPGEPRRAQPSRERRDPPSRQHSAPGRVRSALPGTDPPAAASPWRRGVCAGGRARVDRAAGRGGTAPDAARCRGRGGRVRAVPAPRGAAPAAPAAAAARAG